MFIAALAILTMLVVVSVILVVSINDNIKEKMNVVETTTSLTGSPQPSPALFESLWHQIEYLRKTRVMVIFFIVACLIASAVIWFIAG